MSLRWAALFCACGLSTTIFAEPALFQLNSSCDFSDISLRIYKDGPYNSVTQEIPVSLYVTLTPDAQARMTEVTSRNLKKEIALVIDGKQIRATTVLEVIHNSNLQISLNHQDVYDLLPKLLAKKEVGACSSR
ncbi:SecDF P1 head subdomain-containing protein [Burkholderia ubonensis]|uniref:SecDF P1 head subdomain-containing protein n=1 Tax=Burkholderia ubonensis TaxID=101571 RepID=UPI0012F84058|nr:hypothetical protein [Burkholderia ubonensis]